MALRFKGTLAAVAIAMLVLLMGLPSPAKAATDGWVDNADGSISYLENGKPVTGFFTVDGVEYYASPLTGSVLDEDFVYFDGDGTRSIHAVAGSGALETRSGLVTRMRNGVEEQCFLRHGEMQTGLVAAGSSERYLARETDGVFAKGKVAYRGALYLADPQTGRLQGPGWVITDAYDGETHRYFVNDDFTLRTGYFSAEDNGERHDYYANPRTGMVQQDPGYSDTGELLLPNIHGVLEAYDPSGDPELDAILRKIIREVTGFDGDSLRRSYDWLKHFPYSKMNENPQGEWSVPYAKEMYYNGTGNCYRYAALQTWIARALRYDAAAVSGYVLGRTGTRSPHGWTEVYLDGNTYTLDPDMAHAYLSYEHLYNFYLVPYGQAAINYRFY